MNPDDAELIAAIQRATHGSSAILCTLARRGKALDLGEPGRAAQLLADVSTHPLYKGGRLAFDMLEIEDVILDHPAGATLSLAELTTAVSVLSTMFGRMTDMLAFLGLDGALSPSASAPARPTAPVGNGASTVNGYPVIRLGPEKVGVGNGATGPLPALVASDYLYDFVVLGLLEVVGMRRRR